VLAIKRGTPGMCGLQLGSLSAWQGSGRSLPHSTLDLTLSTAALSVAALLLGQLTVSSSFWWLDAKLY